MRVYWNEGRRIFEQVLAGSEGIVGSLRARALSAAATLAEYQGDIGVERHCVEKALHYRTHSMTREALRFLSIDLLQWPRREATSH